MAEPLYSTSVAVESLRVGSEELKCSMLFRRNGDFGLRIFTASFNHFNHRLRKPFAGNLTRRIALLESEAWRPRRGLFFYLTAMPGSSGDTPVCGFRQVP